MYRFELPVRRLQRVVPVAVAVRGQARPVQEMTMQMSDRFADMVPDRNVPLGEHERPPHGVRNPIVQNRGIARREQVVAEHLQRPDDDVAVAFLLLDRRIPIEHEPLRPVAIVFVLVGEDDFQDVPHHASPAFLRRVPRGGIRA
jgi:hypothetical protein